MSLSALVNASPAKYLAPVWSRLICIEVSKGINATGRRTQKINDLKLCKRKRKQEEKEWKFNRELGESGEETAKEVEENAIGQKLQRIKYELIGYMNYKGVINETKLISWKIVINSRLYITSFFSKFLPPIHYVRVICNIRGIFEEKSRMKFRD